MTPYTEEGREPTGAEASAANHVADWLIIDSDAVGRTGKEVPNRPPHGSLVNVVLDESLQHGYVMGLSTGGLKRPLGASVMV